jgi:Putative Ig domain
VDKGQAMSITEVKNAFVDAVTESIALSQMFAVTATSTDPAYLVLTVLDRDEYTAGASNTTGTLTGNGHTLKLSSLGGDGRGTGIVFTYQASTGQYYNSTYGYLGQFTYTSSSSLDDVTSLSLFGTSNLSVANAYATDAYNMMQTDPSGYLGSATVVTEPRFTTTVPPQATPDSIAAVADSFVGQAWNMDGCWVLASTIAAEAGASLPVQSTLIGLPGQSNGEWIVAYNGPAGQSGNWESMVTAGEIIVIGTPGGGGHITTCVSGSGATAMLVDNITYENSSGQILNAANDGSSSDVIISAAHLASQEWAGVQASSVVIYELDTPIVTDKVATDTLALRASQSLASLFAATDPASKTITDWQVYDTASSDALTLGGITYEDHSVSDALTAVSLAAVDLVAGSSVTTDTLEVRAYNGTYWGDWESLSVAIATTAPSPPVLETQTPSQTWDGGTAILLALPSATFQDPQHETLSYSADLSNGQSLPSWLTFNGTTDTFAGMAPTTAQSLTITVTATDTSGLSVAETFSATVVGTPEVTAQTPAQTWLAGKAISLALPSNTFTDPQGEKLTYSATLSNGQALPGWLTFNATTDSFSGTAPATTQSLGIKVTATDTSGLSTSESFTANVQAAPSAQPVAKPGITVTDPTHNQTWTDGTSVDVVLPSNTFTDALGLKMSFAAYQTSGPNVTAWLYFNPTTDTLYGTVPATETGTVGIEVIASDSQHVTATDLFSVTLAPSPGHTTLGVWAGAVASTLQPDMSNQIGVYPFQT